MKSASAVTLLTLFLASECAAGLFGSDKQGVVFQTRGEALIMRSSTFTLGVERKNIPIKIVIDLRDDTGYAGLVHDSESGWTKCRVPLKGEVGITGITERSLVFDCKPLQYYGR